MKRLITGLIIFSGLLASVRAQTGMDDYERKNLIRIAIRGDNLYVSSPDSGLRYSNNLGQSWLKATGVPFFANIVSILTVNNEVIAAGSGDALYRSADNGNSWLTTNTNLENACITSLAAGDGILLMGGYNGKGVRLSDDNGYNWKSLGTYGLTSTDVYSVAVCNNIIFAGTREGIFTSANNGESWTEANNGLKDITVRALAVIGKIILTATDDGIYRSFNYGTYWNEANKGLPFNPVIADMAVDENKVYAATSDGVFVSADSGASWKPVHYWQKIIGGMPEPAPVSLDKVKKAIADLFDADMVYVQGDHPFMMGCTEEQKVLLPRDPNFKCKHCDCNEDEFPPHEVKVSSFYISKYEITQQQWQKIMGYNPSTVKRCKDCPVNNVSWEEVQTFIKKLNEMTGNTYRLPTEAEWEYAARGGNRSRVRYRYAGSNNIELVGWYSDNAGDGPRPVGKKMPNELGLYDMTGNVREYCSDYYDPEYYKKSPSINPKGPEKNTGYIVVRGGHFYYANYFARWTRVACREKAKPTEKNEFTGFRLVKEINK